MQVIIRSYLATLLFLGLGLTFYTQISPWHLAALNRMLEFGSDGALVGSVFNAYIWIVLVYAALLPFYYAQTRMESKALIVLRSAWRFIRFRRLPRAEETLAFRILLLKFFFAPLMISWLLQHLAGFWEMTLYAHPSGRSSWIDLYNQQIHAPLIHLVIFADVLCFTLGYLIDHPRLKNSFVSVDPTLSGWLVCIICYPPFNQGLKAFIGWYSSDAPVVGDAKLQFAINIAVLLSFSIYSAASVNLGFKASNLTNRGIVTHGVYRWMRHPAYTFKNLAWWLGAMPALWAAFGRSAFEVIAILLSLCGWTAIYAARALTEERHLLMSDNGYRQYMQKVRYRFIPGLI
jgi:protein-S-isoprenylcysteine O-methyltransferase Ste14